MLKNMKNVIGLANKIYKNQYKESIMYTRKSFELFIESEIYKIDPDIKEDCNIDNDECFTLQEFKKEVYEEINRILMDKFLFTEGLNYL